MTRLTLVVLNMDLEKEPSSYPLIKGGARVKGRYEQVQFYLTATMVVTTVDGQLTPTFSTCYKGEDSQRY
jgi:hypothetical protein